MSASREALGLLPFEETRLSVRALDVPDGEAARRELRRVVEEGFRGWVCSTGGVIRVAGPEDLERLAGPPLSAELALGDRTLSLRYADPDLGYVARLLTRGEGAEVRVVQHDCLGIAPADGDPDPKRSPKVRYEIYWPVTIDLDDLAAQIGPLQARFVGFLDASPSPSPGPSPGPSQGGDR